MGRKFGDSNGGKPFLQRSGKSAVFKMMGSSPAKTTHPVHGSITTGELGFEEYDIKKEGDIDITRKGSKTIITPETVEKGKSYAEAGVDPAEAKAYWEANPEKRKEYEASLTTPEKITTEPISTTKTVEKPTREQRYRWERPPVVVNKPGGGADLNIGGERVRMNKEEYANYLKTEGYSKEGTGHRGYIRRSTSGKGQLYNPEMFSVSEKTDFDYSEIDYKDPSGRQFRTDEERQKSMDYQETLKKAKEQKKYRKNKKEK